MHILRGYLRYAKQLHVSVKVTLNNCNCNINLTHHKEESENDILNLLTFSYKNNIYVTLIELIVHEINTFKLI